MGEQPSGICEAVISGHMPAIKIVMGKSHTGRAQNLSLSRQEQSVRVRNGYTANWDNVTSGYWESITMSLRSETVQSFATVQEAFEKATQLAAGAPWQYRYAGVFQLSPTEFIVGLLANPNKREQARIYPYADKGGYPQDSTYFLATCPELLALVTPYESIAVQHYEPELSQCGTRREPLRPSDLDPLHRAVAF